MNMKSYLTATAKTQTFLLALSLMLLLSLPPVVAFWGDALPQLFFTILFTASLIAVSLVMLIRPLADIFTDAPWIRPLVILRKGMGVLSASIIVGLFLSKIITEGGSYLASMNTGGYWTMDHYAFLAHLGDLTGIILLITSNTFSKKVLGKNWKRIQKLAYVYFYAGAFYELLLFGSALAAAMIILVTAFVLWAWAANRHRKRWALVQPHLQPHTI